MSYTNAVGQHKKLDQTGSFQWFPGNTIVCNLSGQDEILREIVWLQQQHAQNLSFANKFVWTPYESFHMTVFELLCDYNRKSSHWSDKLSLDSPLHEIDDFFAQALASISFPKNIQMKVERIDKTLIVLKPLDHAVNERLVTFREQASRATGVRFPNHDTYRYHVTFGYPFIQPTPEEEKELAAFQQQISTTFVERLKGIEFERAEYTIFKDMTKFVAYEAGLRNRWLSEFEEKKGIV